MNIDYTDEEEAAKALRGNWRKFESFGWHTQYELDDPDAWGIIYTHNRDSGLLAQSNAEQIAQALAPFFEDEDPDVISERYGHWLCGWVDGYAVRPLKNGVITPAFSALCKLYKRMEDYPVLNDEDYSAKEYEAGLKYISDNGSRFVVDGAPDDWPEKVWKWLWDSEEFQRELDNTDDTGPSPKDAAMKTALKALGLLDDYYDDEEDEEEDKDDV